ncbi:MAG: GNAT family N-acetyltransferase [Rhizobiaceae bacterium]|nr:GNAT family N-acetyltransferase [Rhizobiaceae bacterium]
MDMTIRRARLDEADLLTGLSMRSKQSNGYDDQFMNTCLEELTVTPERMAQGEYWVAERDGICGCVCLGTNNEPGSGEVHAFFIEPEKRRQGIGKMLWNKLLARAEELGLTQLHLDADPIAVPFYKKLGFETISNSPSGSIPGRFIPRMRLIIG